MVKAGIINGFGINADIELGDAFDLAGAKSQFFHITTLLEDSKVLESIDILGFPGGFSFGDHLGSGRVFAQLVKKNLKPALEAFTARGGLIIGICNGFQVLVKMGILPNIQGDWTPEVSLIQNNGGTFIDRWVTLKRNPECKSPWLGDLEVFDVPIRHGEGRFIPSTPEILKKITAMNMIALTYQGENPNGSESSIAGIVDTTGKIFGLMPHPEAFTTKLNHPHWRRKSNVGPLGLRIFENAVDFIKKIK